MSEEKKISLGARDMLWVDTETTGTDPQEHEIIELAAVRRTVDRREIGRFSVKVHPKHLETAQPRALEVNGYTPEGWLGAVHLEDALGKLFDLAELGDQAPVLAGHNVGFDRAFIRAAYDSEGLVHAPLDYHAIDTASLAWPLCAAGRIDGISLAKVCTFFGISNEGEHGAMRDVERAIAVYDALVPPLSSGATSVLFSVMREGTIVQEASGHTRARVRLGPDDAVETLARVLGDEVFERGGPSCIEVLIADAPRARQFIVEVRRLFGRSMGQLRLEAVQRAETAEQALAHARVQIAKLEQAVAARDGAA